MMLPTYPTALHQVTCVSVIHRISLLLALALSPVLSTAAEVNSISGFISTSGKSPIADVHVRLLDALSAAVIDDTLSDSRGSFQFSNLSQGQYRIELKKTGYYNAETLLGGGRRVDIHKNNPTSPEIFLMASNGFISGSVSTEAAVPLKGVRVDLRRPGEKQTAIAEVNALTDDHGEFHFSDVVPGYYSVVAISTALDSDRSTTFVRMTFPPPMSGGEPSFFAVRSGEHYKQISLTLRQSDMHLVKGSVTGVPNNWERQRLAVAVIPAQGARVPVSTAFVDSAGAFTFRGIPDGDYDLVAWGPVHGFGPVGPISDVDALQGTVSLNVSGADISGLEVPLRQSATVSFVVNAMPNDPAAKTCYDRASLTLLPLDMTLPQQALTVPLQSDGVAVFAKVAPGSYEVSLHGKSQNCFIATDTAGSKSIRIASDIRIQATVGAMSGRISGTVVDAQHSAAPGAWVLAAPLEATKRSFLFINQIALAFTDTSGRYYFDSLRPGRYKFLALTRPDPVEWANPGLWERSTARDIASGQQDDGKFELIVQGEPQ